MIKNIILLALLSVFFAGCNQQIQQTLPKQESKLTVGIVQKEIKIGMTQSNVAAILGSPNIVTNPEQDKEHWIYDKISSQVSYSKKESYGTLLLIGNNSSDGTYSSTQKTLTIIIKFNKGKIYDFKYHSTKF